ncbi:MAG: hypothetical protein Q7J16_05675 [Candidatus Cloacimonadales bacterium]|nr:hypothetical protein [Candidatus Cloacimonadales bacterium]
MNNFKSLPIKPVYWQILEGCKTEVNQIINVIRQRFQDRISFDRNDLYELLREFQPELKESTFAWMIYNLKKRKILKPIKRGVYTLVVKPEYQPDLSDKLKRIFSAVKRENFSDNICIWSSACYNEFMIHQPMRNIIILEVDSDILETVYFFLKDHIYKKVYLQPDENQMLNYAMEEQEPVILLPFISRSPITIHEKISTPALEKILVDAFVASKLLYWIQGKELSNIYEGAYNKYQLNFTTLASYARRRGAEAKLMEFLKQKTDIPQELFI